MIDVVNWVDFLLAEESSQQDLRGILDVCEAFQDVILLLNLMLVVQGRRDLVFVPLKRNELIVPARKLRYLFLDSCQLVEVSLDTLL
jgi:hypothetical protein